MRKRLCIVIVVAAMVLAKCGSAWAVSPTAGEMESATRFSTDKLLSADPANLPFSFVYGGKPSKELLKAWQRTEKTENFDACRTRRIVEYTDPATKLQVRCEAILYHDFPTVEWTLYFKNTGAADSPILENVQALDAVW